MTTGTRQQSFSWKLFLGISIYLIARFLWRIVVAGGGWPLPPWHYISMGIDVALLVALISMRPDAASRCPR
jgi:hypothetical protein